MPEPEIRYCTTSDGINLAYWTLGEGRPFILPPGTVTSPSLRAWRTTAGHAFFERLAAHRMLVRYDARGFGLSQSGAVDFSLEAQVRDLAGVVDKLGADRVALCAYLWSGPAVLAYAARYPARVSRLVLWATSPRGLRGVEDDLGRILNDLAKVDFELWKEAMVAAAMRTLGVDPSASEYARSIVEGMGPEWLRSLVEQDDVTDLLGSIEAPTLIIHRRGVREPSIGEVQAMAARIPTARLALLEGDSAVLYMGDTDSVLAALEEFLGEGSTQASPARGAHGGLVTVILFADIADSTALTERMGDAAFRAKARDLDVALRRIITEAGGTTIDAKTLGDGVLATFPGASQGIAAALACGAAADAQGLQLHLGLHAGDVIREANNVFGGAVNIASRISALSAPGEVLVSDIVRGLARTSAGVEFEDRGKHALKGVGDAQRVYAVRKDRA
jgi:class 3 adenylate cyclase